MGIKSTLRDLESKTGDAILGISTLGTKRGDYPDAESENDDSFWYESKSYYLNWLYLKPLRLRQGDIVYDIGCGAGRLLFIAALSGVKSCVGIELSLKLSELARSNAAKLRLAHAPVEIHQADASKADFSEGTVFLFCNPFGAKTLEAVMDQIRRSLATHPREIRMMYIHPEPGHREYFDRCGWLEKTGEKTFPGAWGIPAFYFKFGPDSALEPG
ncbi:MAG: class I SAM-dependent methyltransferase [Verrucomicrobiota bacterium]